MAKATKKDEPRSPTAQRLRRLRAAEGYETATAFAAKLGISAPRYFNFEGGLPLSLDVAQRIVKAVPGCSLDWLYNEVESGLSVSLRQRLAGEGTTKGSTARSDRASG